MNDTCDMCLCNLIDKEKISLMFLVLEGKVFTSEDHKLSDTKEICPDCFKKLVNLFKKGGEDE